MIVVAHDSAHRGERNGWAPAADGVLTQAAEIASVAPHYEEMRPERQ